MELPDPNYKVCNKCPHPAWKPDRAHHCSVTKACVPKMDHFCPFVLTCVGFSNHKTFILFCLFQMIGLSIGLIGFFIWCYFDLLEFLSNFPLSTRPIIVAAIVGDALGAIAFWMFSGGMGLAHLSMSTNNGTTLDELAIQRDGDMIVGSLRGVWNFGLFYNLRCIGFSGWGFWVPKKHDDKYEGYYWPRIGKAKEYLPVNFSSKIKCVKNGKMQEIDSLEEVCYATRMAYSGYAFTYLDQVFEVDKVSEDEIKQKFAGDLNKNGAVTLGSDQEGSSDSDDL